MAKKARLPKLEDLTKGELIQIIRKQPFIALDQHYITDLVIASLHRDAKALFEQYKALQEKKRIGKKYTDRLALELAKQRMWDRYKAASDKADRLWRVQFAQMQERIKAVQREGCES